MEQISEEMTAALLRVCAIDIGKAGLVACVRVPHETNPDRRVQEVREYATVTAALLALADWLRCHQVQLVAMEATSSYWKPVFYLLEAEGFRCWLLNARHVVRVRADVSVWVRGHVSVLGITMMAWVGWPVLDGL